MASQPDYIVECTDCEMGIEIDDFNDALTFSMKHREHTLHETEWTRLNLDMVSPELVQYRVDCDTCEDQWFLDTREEAEAFVSEHSEFTNHEPDGITEVEDIFEYNSDEEHSLKQLVESCEQLTEKGAPKEVVIKYASLSGLQPDQANDMLDELRSYGEVYVPAQGFLRTT